MACSAAPRASREVLYLFSMRLPEYSPISASTPSALGTQDQSTPGSGFGSCASRSAPPASVAPASGRGLPQRQTSMLHGTLRPQLQVQGRLASAIGLERYTRGVRG